MMRYLILTVVLQINTGLFASVPVFTGKQVSKDMLNSIRGLSDSKVNTFFNDYQLYQFDAEVFKQYIHASSGNEVSFKMKMGNNEWNLKLWSYDLRSFDYVLKAATPGGVLELPKSENAIYKGFLVDDPGSNVIFRVDGNDLFGMIKTEDGETYFEQANYYGESIEQDLFLLYSGADMMEIERTCNFKETLPPSVQEDISVTSSGQACRVADYGIAADYFYVRQQGGIHGAEMELLLTLALVQIEYDVLDIQYSVKTIFLPASLESDPFWVGNNNLDQVAANFKAWEGAGGFGNVSLDLATLWVNRNLCIPGNCSVAGQARIGGVCSSNQKGNVDEYVLYYYPRAYSKIFQAHENGHTFGAVHEWATSRTIMTASVRSYCTGWTTANANAIKQGAAKSCLSNCSAAPVAYFTLEEGDNCSGTFNFKDFSENTPTSWLWDFGDGSTSSEQNPIHTYAAEGKYNVSLTASNSAGTHTLTKNQYVVVEKGIANPIQFIGPKSKGTDGTFSEWNSGGKWLTFKVLKDLELVSIKVFVQGAGERCFLVSQEGQSEYIYTNRVTLKDGENRVVLHNKFTPGTYKFITLAFPQIYLTKVWQDNSGVSYPQEIPGLISIYSNHMMEAGNPAGGWYGAYDWEIRELGCNGTVGIQTDLAGHEAIEIYPNPGNGKFYINLPGPLKDQPFTVSIYDFTGKQVFYRQPDAGKNEMDLSGLLPGNYFVRINSEQFNKTERIIVTQ